MDDPVDLIHVRDGPVILFFSTDKRQEKNYNRQADGKSTNGYHGKNLVPGQDPVINAEDLHVVL